MLDDSKVSSQFQPLNVEKDQSMCSPRVRVVSAVAVGTVLLFFGILALTLIPSIVDRAVLDQDWLGYNEGTKELNAMTKSWQRPPYDMKLQIYLFNVTNPEAAMQGAKPIVQEIGPFTFIEEMEKTFKFSPNGSRVIYRNKKTYHFNQTLSCPTCELSTRIFIPNIIFQKLVDFSTKGILAKFAVQAVLTAFRRETAFYQVSADEILFKGYVDPILGEVCKKPIISAFCGTAIPERIGIFYGQNGTDDGSYEISTGKGAPWDIGKIYSWNGKTALDNSTWDSPYARMINGTDGQLFPPLIQKGDSFNIFNSQAGRTIYMEYEGVSSYRDVPAYRFGIPSAMFDGTLAKNADFCNKDTPVYFNSTIQPPGCLPKGFIDVGRTQPGAPRVYLSQAHFFDVEPLVAEKILGMRSGTQKNDTTFVDIEPTSGAPIRARRAMQLSVGMLKGNLDLTAKLNQAIVPLLWMNETILFDEGTRDQLKNQLLLAKHLAFISGVGLVIAGATVWIALAAVLLIFSVSRVQPASEDTTILVEEEQQHEDVPELDYTATEQP